MIWHILDVRAVWIKEFAAALAAQTPTLGWCPQISATGMLRGAEHETTLVGTKLRVRYFPLQRGFARFPVNMIAREADRITRRLLEQSDDPAGSILVCCSPHYAAVAERWPGRVIYYATDLFSAWGEDPARIAAFERRMCAAVDLVFPDSQRIADHLISQCGCPRDRIHISPMATRAENLLEPHVSTPLTPPEDIADLSRPICAVIGNLATNMDWLLLKEVVARTPWLSWVFVGPTIMTVSDQDHREARNFLVQHGGRVRFVGEKPYGELKHYARAADVAILPYRNVEPTRSGSSTRFYEHLAATRPMLATRAFEELLYMEPLLTLVDNADQVVDGLCRLRELNFRDGLEELRRQTSLGETWEARAAHMRSMLIDGFSYAPQPAATLRSNAAGAR